MNDQDPPEVSPARSTPRSGGRPPHSTEVAAYVGLGSNQGDRLAELRQALAALGAVPGVRVEDVSRFYESEPWGYANQPCFVNAVARVRTTLGPRQLLVVLKWIERRQGRERAIRWGPRNIDLDLLLYDELVVCRPGLVVPHKHMHERAFVLAPLRDLYPEYHGPDGRGLDELLRVLDAERVIWPIE